MLSQLEAPSKVLLRGVTTVSHSAAGAITTNIDLTGLPANGQTVERLLGVVCSAVNYYHASIRRNGDQLEIRTVAVAGGMNVVVSWDILRARGRVQKGVVNVTSSTSDIVTVNATILEVGDMARARVHPGGMAATANAGYNENSLQQLTARDNLQVRVARTSGSLVYACPYVIEY